MALIQSNSRSSNQIRIPLKSINYASKYRIYEKFHYFGAHFTEIQGFCHEKDAQNVITGYFFTKKLFIMSVKFLLEVQNTNNSEFGCY